MMFTITTKWIYHMNRKYRGLAFLYEIFSFCTVVHDFPSHGHKLSVHDFQLNEEENW